VFQPKNPYNRHLTTYQNVIEFLIKENPFIGSINIEVDTVRPYVLLVKKTGSKVVLLEYNFLNNDKRFNFEKLNMTMM
jgi:hypothetical protein